MMRKFSTWLLGLFVAVAVSACCGSVACECDDNLDDAIFFQFNLDSLGTTGFRSADIDTVVLIRKPYIDPLLPPPTSRPPNDTARIIRSRTLVDTPIILNTNAPFTPGGGRKLDAYDYQLYVVRHFDNTLKIPPVKVVYTLNAIRLEGRFVGDGCCTCYENTAKRLRVTPDTIANNASPLDLHTPDGAEPKPVVLSR